MGELREEGPLLGLSNSMLESLHRILPEPKPDLVAGFLVNAGSWTGSLTSSFRPLLLVRSCVGEFGDVGRLLGLSNIESPLHGLLSKPGLVADFLEEAGS